MVFNVTPSPARAGRDSYAAKSIGLGKLHGGVDRAQRISKLQDDGPALPEHLRGGIHSWRKAVVLRPSHADAILPDSGPQIGVDPLGNALCDAHVVASMPCGLKFLIVAGPKRSLPLLPPCPVSLRRTRGQPLIGAFAP